MNGYTVLFLIVLLQVLVSHCCIIAADDEQLPVTAAVSSDDAEELRLLLPLAAAGDPTTNEGGLVWNDLVVLTSGEKKAIVQKTSGMVPNGSVCGILGPSGAGKSSLVSALAGNSPLDTTGQVWRFHRSMDEPQQREFTTTSTTTKNDTIVLTEIYPDHVAWLEQHDHFFEMLTVQETLETAAYLELPFFSSKQRTTLVQNKIQALGLASVAHRRVGTYLSGQSRLSGGERRRLSVALELLTQTEKDLFVADEPTTGLDASMSARVMRLIHTVAHEFHVPALCVLHQPRSSVWHALDYVLLLAPGGRVCFHGPRSAAVSYFAALGYACPVETNPAEFLVDLISIDPEDPVKAAADDDRVEGLAQAFARYQEKQWKQNDDALKQSKNLPSIVISSSSSLRQENTLQNHFWLRPVRWISRFGALLQRSLRQNFRNRASLLARLVISAANAVLLTQLFPTVQGPIPTANSMADRAALLTTAAITVCNMAFMKAADLFEKEYPVVRREQVRQQYSSLEYLLAKVVAEMPMDAVFAALFSTILKQCSGLRISWTMLTQVFALLTASGVSLGFLMGGMFAGDGLSVNAGFPFLVVLMLVGVINPSGVAKNQMPSPVTQFIKHLSPFAYAINALMIGEYKDLEFVSTSGLFSKLRDLPRLGAMSMVQNGNQVLDALGLAHETYNKAMKGLSLITIANLCIGWFGLARQNFVRQRAIRRKQKANRSSSKQQQPTTTTTKMVGSSPEPTIATIRRVKI